MPIEAELPDGTVLEFPDGTADAIVQSRVKQHLGVQVDQFADVRSGASTTAPQDATDITPEDLNFERNLQEPTRRSAASRFIEPVSNAVKGIPKLVGDLADANLSAMTGDPSKAVEFGKNLIAPHVAQLEKAKQALGEGRISEAIGHGGAAALPVFGPPAADIGEALGEGNVAGALGQGAVMLAPKGITATGDVVSSVLRSRAATQALEAIGSGKGGLKLKQVLNENPQLIEDLGVGSRSSLLEKAAKQRSSAGDAIKALQADTTPVSAQSAINQVLGKANEQAINVPAAGQSLIERSGNAPLRDALRAETSLPAEMESGYAGQIPAGELFRLRAQLGRRASSAYDRTPGSPPPVSSEAPAAMRDALSDTLHQQVPQSKVADAAYSNWNKISNRLKKSADADINAKNNTSFGDYMKGRIASATIGAAAGGAVGNLPGAAAGGLVGVILAKSPFWHSLKATTYAKMARYINAADYPAAYTLLANEAGEYGISSDLDRNRKAREILNNQAQGSLE